MQYQLLGPMTVIEDGMPLPLGGFRQRCVLAVLLLGANRAVDVDVLVDQVWDGAPPAKPITSVRAYIANLRKALGAHRLVTQGHGYRLELGRDSLDTRNFETLTGQGKRLLEAGDAAGAQRCLVQALALWRGHPLVDFRDSVFAEHETRRLEAIRADAVEARYEAELLLGHAAELVDGLRGEVAANPLREQLWGHLMIALYRCGRRADALAEYERLRGLLDEELGVGPSNALDRIAGDIRRESASLAAPSVTTRQVANAPLFGRAPEFERLRQVLFDVANGRGGAAVLLGESGVGKTALTAEICRLADDLGMATVWAGHPVGSALPPAWAWTQVIRTLAPATGPQIDGSATDHVDTLASSVEELAGGRPTVIVLDDLHRADDVTYRVLDMLVSRAPRRPLLILATWQDGRPGHPLRAADFDRTLARSEITQVRLAGLDVDATAELIESVTGIEPHGELVGSVHDRTGGNPFFIRELVRLLDDHGKLERSTGSIAGIDDVPHAVSGVVRRRLADLPPGTREALLLAAAVGGEFSVTITAAALGIPPDQLVDDLESAVEAGFVVAMDPGRMRFSHGIIREAVAAQTAGAAQARSHAAIALAYRSHGSVAPDERFAAAEHAWLAGPYVDADTALALLDQARAAAWSASAYQEVAELCTRTIDVLGRAEPSPAARVDREAALWLQLVSVQAVTRGQNSAVVREALKRLQTSRSGATAFTVAAAFSALEASGSGRHRDAAMMADGLIADFTRTGDPVAGSAGHYLRALSAFMRADIETASASIDALLHAVPAVDVQTYGHLAAFDVRGHGAAAWIAAVRGDRRTAEIWVERGTVLADARGDAFGRAVVEVSRLQVRAILADVDGTADMARAVDTTLRGMGIDQLAASARVIGGWAGAVGTERSDTADMVRDAIASHAVGGTRIFLPLYHLLLADVLIAHNRFDEATVAIDAAETTAAAIGERVWRDQTAARWRAVSAAGGYRPDLSARGVSQERVHDVALPP